MPIYRLSQELIFPHPEKASKDGILALGGDLSIERIILAYSNGIFPWFNEGDPILWWSPKERCIIYPDNIKISKSMKKLLNKEKYKVTFDCSFEEVINACASTRKETGTWITDDMINAYTELYNCGLAHSVKVWNEGELVGGLYGISLGRFFFGESMFSKMPGASKVALIKLSQKATTLDFLFIDCQIHNPHLESMGAVKISRKNYLKVLEAGLEFETLRGPWK